MGTGAVSRYNLYRSRKVVMMQKFDCVQMSESGFSSHYKFVLGAGAKAKTVTSNLPLLSVLWLVLFCSRIRLRDLNKLFVRVIRKLPLF